MRLNQGSRPTFLKIPKQQNFDGSIAASAKQLAVFLRRCVNAWVLFLVESSYPQNILRSLELSDPLQELQWLTIESMRKYFLGQQHLMLKCNEKKAI